MNPDPTSLDRLHDIIAPPPVPWWPPAPGWYCVIGFAFFVLLIGLVRLFLHWQRNRYRREALLELARQEAALRNSIQPAGALAALAELLKRVSLSAWPREDVASLTGEPWLAFLQGTFREKHPGTREAALLESVAYDPRAAGSLDESQILDARRAVRHWIRHHKTR